MGSTRINTPTKCLKGGEPFGLAVRYNYKAGKQRDLSLKVNLLQLSFLFKNCGLWILKSRDFVPHN